MVIRRTIAIGTLIVAAFALAGCRTDNDGGYDPYSAPLPPLGGGAVPAQSAPSIGGGAVPAQLAPAIGGETAPVYAQ